MGRARSSSDSRPPGLALTLLVAGVLLLLAAFVFVAFAPAFECPECDGGRSGIFTLNDGRTLTVTAGCPTCGGKNRVSLIQKWKYRKSEEARSESRP